MKAKGAPAGKRSRTKHSGNLGITFKQAFCGQGLGRKLMAFMEEWIANGKVITKVNFVVHEDNSMAMRFYGEIRIFI